MSLKCATARPAAEKFSTYNIAHTYCTYTYILHTGLLWTLKRGYFRNLAESLDVVSQYLDFCHTQNTKERLKFLLAAWYEKQKEKVNQQAI